MAIMSFQTHIIHWRKLKKTHGKIFSQTNYMKQDSTKNHLASVKTNRASKYTLSVQKLRITYNIKHKGSSKKYYPFIILVMSSKNESINLKLPKY